MDRKNIDIAEVRSRICNVFLVVAVGAAVPALAASLYRTATTGWLPIMSVQVVLFLVLVFMVLFRNRIPYGVRAAFIVAAFLALGHGGLLQVGLVGSAIVFLVAAPALSAIFFGTRAGVNILALAIVSTGIVGAYSVLEHRLPPFDVATYALQPSSWTTMIVGWSLVAASLLAAVIMYNRDLSYALGKANRSEEELASRVEERTLELTREIEERRAVEAELRQAEAALIEANSWLEEKVEARTHELEAEKELFRSIVENSPVELSLKNLDGTYTAINPVARSYYQAGGQEEVSEGKTAYEFWPKDLADVFAEHDRAVVEAGHALTFEDIMPTRDGVRVIKTTKFPVRNMAGETTGIGTVGIDVTNEKEAETKLRESEERFRSLFENSPNAVSLKDIEGRYLLINERFETLMGVNREYVLGKTTDQVFKGEFAEMGMKHDRQAIERKQTVQSDERYYRGDQVIIFSTTKFPIFDGCGNVIAVATVHTDLTKRIEAENALLQRESEYRQLVELNPDAVIVQCDGKIVLANQSACKMFAASSTEDLIGLDSLSIVYPDSRDFILRQREHVLRDHVAVPPLETRHRRIDGTSFHSEFTAGPVVWNGQPGTINLIRDVTVRKRTEAQLQQAQKMEAVGQLTGGLAHDFNNLLAIILGNADILADVVGEKHKPQADAVIRAAQRGADLTHRLLAFSRQQALEPKTVNVNDILTDMVELLRRTLGEHIEIETRTEGDLWACAIDPAQLENALLNLAINARDAMSDGGKLTIETANVRMNESQAVVQTELKPGDYVMISVSDTGTGMAAEVREQVFEPFFTTKEVGKGTGLGLSMVYGFVKQSGGHITIDSDVGVGTTVRLYLPRATYMATPARERSHAGESGVGKGEVILVVEDDADLRTMIVQMLESLDYRVLEADTGETALKILKRATPVNLLLTDVVLTGGMSGRALADRAREKYSNLSVLYMSGYTGDVTVRQGRLDDGVQLLEKPFRKPEIAQAVRYALNGV